MTASCQKQPQIKILPAFSIDEKQRLKETDLNEITRMVEGLLPQYVNRDIDVTITLLEKNLRIMADMALMKEAVTHLLENAMDAMPGSGKFSLSINRVNFEIESLLDGDDSMLGACAFISLSDNGVVIDEKIKKKIFDPFYITGNQGKGPGLPIAYRIIKQQQGSMKIERRLGQGTEVNIYLPLTKPEIVSKVLLNSLLLVFFVLIPVCGFCFQNEPAGFRGIQWGTEISTLEHMVLVKEKPDNSIQQGLKMYYKKSEVMTKGRATLNQVGYIYFKDKFISAQILTEGSNNWLGLKDDAFEIFGKGEQIDQNFEQYCWFGNKANIKLNYNKETERGSLSIVLYQPNIKVNIRIIWSNSGAF